MRDEHRVAARLRILRPWLLFAAAVVLIAVVGGNHWRREALLLGIPPDIETTHELLSTDAMGGFLEGCGLRVHRLSPTSEWRIRMQGLSFFAHARTGRDGGEYYRYDPWKATPALPGDRVLRGLKCVALDGAMERVLERALQNALGMPGSFFAMGDEYDILVVPSLGLVVVSYSG